MVRGGGGGGGGGGEWLAMGTEVFIAAGVFPVELLAYQVSVVSVWHIAIDRQNSSIYIHQSKF